MIIQIYMQLEYIYQYYPSLDQSDFSKCFGSTYQMSLLSPLSITNLPARRFPSHSRSEINKSDLCPDSFHASRSPSVLFQGQYGFQIRRQHNVTLERPSCRNSAERGSICRAASGQRTLEWVIHKNTESSFLKPYISNSHKCCYHSPIMPCGINELYGFHIQS